MRAQCYTLEDAHTIVVQPEGKSSLLRLRLPPEVNALSLRTLLRASPQQPAAVTFNLGAWDQGTGTFIATALAEPLGPEDTCITNKCCNKAVPAHNQQ